MVLECPCSSKYLADFWLNSLIGYGKIGRAQTKKSATSIVALNPPKEDGGVVGHLVVAAPKARVNQSVVGLDYLLYSVFYYSLI
jgi:hypothetical protein